MSDITLKPDELEAFVIRRKQAWRELAHAMSWEEKVAAIERMWERDKSLKAAREKIKQASKTSV
jgi:hypothetical protein